MRAAWYERQGPAVEVIEVGDMAEPHAGPGEVRVRLAASGVNPSDVKRRSGWGGQQMGFERIVPHSDGAGVIDQIGDGVDPARVGERVWVYNAQWKRPFGTAAEFVALPAGQAIHLPDGTGFAEGACLAIPGMTAHRCVFADGSVEAKTVLVTGGAGAVGFYATQLAKWGGATVITTVSSKTKAETAAAAGADLVVDYRTEDVATRIMEFTHGAGVDRIVEVDFGVNLPVTDAVLRPHGVIAVYASMTEPKPVLPFYAFMRRNVLVRFVFLYEIPPADLTRAAQDINACLDTGSLRHLIAERFPLAETVAAHVAVESGRLIGNAVIEIDS